MREAGKKSGVNEKLGRRCKRELRSTGLAVPVRQGLVRRGGRAWREGVEGGRGGRRGVERKARHKKGDHAQSEPVKFNCEPLL